MKRVFVFFCFSFFVVISVFFFCSKKDSDVVQITLKGKKDSVSYFVELAVTPQEAQTGLMWRKSMPQNQGMLFVFPQPKIIKMWMKNTYIPLDMVFINSQNQVICLRENAQPLDESVITCPYPVQKVLEVNAGQIKAQNIHLGDMLQ